MSFSMILNPSLRSKAPDRPPPIYGLPVRHGRPGPSEVILDGLKQSEVCRTTIWTGIRLDYVHEYSSLSGTVPALDWTVPSEAWRPMFSSSWILPKLLLTLLLETSLSSLALSPGQD